MPYVMKGIILHALGGGLGPLIDFTTIGYSWDVLE
jgi:hypothetical protein